MKILYLFLALTISFSAYSQKYVSENGKLLVLGNQLCNEKKLPVQLKGFCTYNLTFCPACVTYDAMKSNKEFWGANVVRATVYTDDWWNDQSYNKNPKLNKDMVDSVVRWCEMLDLYVIIDWHILTKGNPNSKIHAGADAFFEEMSKKYASKKHVIYEICNEPNGDNVTWDTIADYANRIIPIIRKNDPQSVIIVGTPGWCQRLGDVDILKLTDSKNLLYAFHFYAASHLNLLPVLEKEMHRIPVFVSEWSACEYTGNGDVNFENSEKFIQAMKQHSIEGNTVSVSWCFFSYADIKEAASALEPESCKNKTWENMSPTGFFIRKYLKE